MTPEAHLPSTYVPTQAMATDLLAKDVRSEACSAKGQTQKENSLSTQLHPPQVFLEESSRPCRHRQNMSRELSINHN